jgi:hypothetical protein
MAVVLNGRSPSQSPHAPPKPPPTPPQGAHEHLSKFVIRPEHERRRPGTFGEWRTCEVEAMPSSQLGILTHPYVLAGNCGRVGELHGYQFAEMKFVPVPLSAEGQGNVSRCWQGVVFCGNHDIPTRRTTPPVRQVFRIYLVPGWRVE